VRAALVRGVGFDACCGSCGQMYVDSRMRLLLSFKYSGGEEGVSRTRLSNISRDSDINSTLPLPKTITTTPSTPPSTEAPS